jgi:hypothetical protein
MITTIIIVAIIIFVVIIGNAVSRKSNTGRSYRQNQITLKKPQQPAPYKNTPLPALLGIQPQLPIQQAVIRLEQALAGEFTSKLKARVLSKQPRMTPAEFEWKLLELKRYFLMTAVLKDVPMYSDAVDDIWHEMLMFTREYNQFGEAFLGSAIHHAPHTGSQPEPDPSGRAWFDWVYAHMFVHTSYSGRIWGPFFRHPLSHEFLEELKLADESALISRMFNQTAASRYPEIRNSAAVLIRKAKKQAAGAIPGAKYYSERPTFQSAGYMPYLAGALMFYSATELGSFDSLMEQHYSEEEARQRQQDAGGGDYSYGSSTSGGDGSGDSSGGDSGGSSSSSCSSSSCSSGCGGGGGD